MQRVVLALFSVLVCTSAFAQATELTIDLKDAGTVAIQVPPGDYSVRIINKLPSKQYNVTTEIKQLTEAPVSIAQARTAPPAVQPVEHSAAELRFTSFTDCTTLLAEATTTYAAATTPEAKSATIITIRAKGIAKSCADVVQYANDRCADLLRSARTAIAAATSEAALAALTAPLRILGQACPDIGSYVASIDQVLDPSAIGRSEILTVTIVRTNDNTTWIRQFTTGKRGEWLSGYGILLVPNRDANYSSYSLGGDEYEIRRSRDREKFDYVPTLTFTFMRPADVPRSWFTSPVFGIGYDLQTISGTVGYAATYNHNFSISAGVMLHQQRRLKGKYEEGEHYTKSGNVLENSDLTETTWAPNIYVGITIRSLTNPFAR